jgi:hypothetical protein
MWIQVVMRLVIGVMSGSDARKSIGGASRFWGHATYRFAAREPRLLRHRRAASSLQPARPHARGIPHGLISSPFEFRNSARFDRTVRYFGGEEPIEWQTSEFLLRAGVEVRP